ncbi:MAG: methionine--tRNA ligase [Vicinamibacteria bacterium]|nr:methionine--tRNA ligase [Vicinamibacteria bacterium]
MKSFYVTTPIYYVNAAPHAGHAYTTIAADALKRALRLAGRRAFLLTGTDEHGQNIERVAREQGIPEQELCDRNSARFRAVFDSLDVAYDRFIRTTDDVHKRGVLAIWERVAKATAPDGRSAVYSGTYAGWYCPRCEGFKDEDELVQPDNRCLTHEQPCEWTEEQNLFFRLSAYSDWLKAEIESGRLRIDPEVRRNEVLAVIRDGLKDFSVSRARVKWGIPVPERPDHVLYVWVDALSNYVTALGYADGDALYREFWEQGGVRLHVVGKDIIRFHCLYWPALLKAAELPRPTHVFVQGHITKNGRKVAKSTGNIIDPEALIRDFGLDAVRYFLLREAPYGADWDFTDDAFLKRFNADLANDFGNLVSRALTMVHRYCDGRVPPRVAPGEDRSALVESCLARYEKLEFAGALSEVWAHVARANQAIVAFEPWTAAKDPARRGELDAFLYRLLEDVRLAALLVSPVMPRAATRVLAMLGRDGLASPDELGWGRLEPGTALSPVEPLFPRKEKPAAAGEAAAPAPIEKKKEKKPVSDAKKDAAPATPVAPAAAAEGVAIIGIEDFVKVDLRVGLVKEAQRVPKSDKLLQMQVDLGSEVRQIVAGIAEHYAPEQVVGRRIVVVANLAPRKLRGVESNGMVLAASPKGRAVLLAVDGDVAPGTEVK